jgi:hypothetical protein
MVVDGGGPDKRITVIIDNPVINKVTVRQEAVNRIANPV